MINSQTIAYPYSHGDLQMAVEYNAAGDPLYIGRSRTGALSSAAEWQIKKITYDADRNPTAVQFASGTNNYDKIWNNRSSGYTYS